MSSEAVIRPRGLGKCYAFYERPQDRLKQMIWRCRQHYRECWALCELDRDVFKGDTVGIVGQNGSGKSTLLQMVSRILASSADTIEVHGRIAPPLELGAGFNPEFTGRENVFVKAAVLGMTREQVRERFDAIAGFDDFGRSLDRPVKTYSTGMVARLGFAVAIHVDPEILIIDETLAVGDVGFWQKCYARLEETCRRHVTVLFVSHAAGTGVDLCDRALLLDGGRRLLTGKPRTIIAHYPKLVHAKPGKERHVRQQIAQFDASGEGERMESAPAVQRTVHAVPARAIPLPEQARFDPRLRSQSTMEYPTRGARIHAPRILDIAGKQVNVLAPRQAYLCQYVVPFDRSAQRVVFETLIKTLCGVVLRGQISSPFEKGIPSVPVGSRWRVQFRFRALFAPGDYFFNVGVYGSVDGEEGPLHRITDVLIVRIEPFPENLVRGLASSFVKPACSAREIPPPSQAARIHPLVS